VSSADGRRTPDGAEQVGMDALFTLFAMFIDEYKKAEVDLARKAEMIEKQKKTDAEKEKREREKVGRRRGQQMDAGVGSCVEYMLMPLHDMG
jgi:hypothetical protein